MERLRSTQLSSLRCRSCSQPTLRSISETCLQTLQLLSSLHNSSQSLQMNLSKSSPMASSATLSHSLFLNPSRRPRSRSSKASSFQQQAVQVSWFSSLSRVRHLLACSSTYFTSKRSLHSKTSLTTSLTLEISSGRTVVMQSLLKSTALKTTVVSSKLQRRTYQQCEMK